MTPPNKLIESWRVDRRGSRLDRSGGIAQSVRIFFLASPKSIASQLDPFAVESSQCKLPRPLGYRRKTYRLTPKDLRRSATEAWLDLKFESASEVEVECELNLHANWGASRAKRAWQDAG